MRTSLRSAVAVLVGLIATAAIHAQSVWVVDAAGGGDFTDLPAAGAAAQDGDVLLIRTGSYSRLSLIDKGLTLVAEEGEHPVVDGLVVGQLLDEQFVLVRGLEFVEQSGTEDTSCVLLFYNNGSVWMEDCVIRFSDDGPPAPNSLALRIDMCGAVTLVDCEVIGRTDTSWADSPYAPSAMCGVVSWIAAHRTTFVGSKGYPATVVDGAAVPPSAGAAGVMAMGSRVFLYDCEVTGGEGGDGGFLLDSCIPGADGGLGLTLPSGESDSLVFDAATEIQGGAPGAVGPGCGTGLPGSDVDVVWGVFMSFPVDGAPRAMSAPAVVREGQTLDLTFTGGVPGELVLVGLSFGSDYVVNRELAGTVVLAPPVIRALHIGVMPATGPLVASFPVGQLPLMQGLPLYLQSLHIGSESNLGTGTATVLLDSAL